MPSPAPAAVKEPSPDKVQEVGTGGLLRHVVAHRMGMHGVPMGPITHSVAEEGQLPMVEVR